jgi:hypothetical protein
VSDAQQIERPPWLEGWQPSPPPAPRRAKPGNPRWTPGCKSPNPAGRPKGIVDRRMQIAQRMFDDAGGIVQAMVEKALEGDTGAASLVLSRVLPAVRSQSEKVSFKFDSTGPVARQVEQVLDAIACGAVAPDVGRQVIEAVEALAAIRATEELEERIAALEARSN